VVVVVMVVAVMVALRQLANKAKHHTDNNSTGKPWTESFCSQAKQLRSERQKECNIFS